MSNKDLKNLVKNVTERCNKQRLCKIIQEIKSSNIIDWNKYLINTESFFHIKRLSEIDYKGGATYDIKFYAKTKKAKQLFSLLEELENNKSCAILASLSATLAHEKKINKVKSEIERLCV